MSYEADQENAELCVRNLHSNDIWPHVQTCAVMADDYPDDTVEFYVGNRPMSLRRHSIFKPNKDFRVTHVPIVRWSDLPLDQFDAVKMNIEGAELRLLEQINRIGNIRKLVFEYSWDKDPSIARFQSILDRLRNYFPYVDHNKRLPAGPTWIHYPPNIFVYCMRS